MNHFAEAQKIADAVLYEGYALYPYRASSAKNRVRFQWGVLVPRTYAAIDPSERTTSQTQCLIDRARDATLRLRVRFLHLAKRELQVLDAQGEWSEVTTIDLGDRVLQTWDDADEVERDVDVSLDDVASRPRVLPLSVPGHQSEERTVDAAGRSGRILRTRQPLEARLTISASRIEGPHGLHKLSVVIENRTNTDTPCADRDIALRHSLVGCHLLMSVEGARFVSQMAPPEWASAYAASCENIGTYPILVGDELRSDLMLSSPIILYDHPQVAPESPADLFDATEIDELLMLRTSTLTDAEKREARGTDPRAAAIIDQADFLPPEMMERLHGAIRGLTPKGTEVDDVPWWDPGSDMSVSPESDAVLVDGVEVRRGARVRLAPRMHRADAQDMFLAGRLADVEAVVHDVDGGVHLAVTPVDDPAADIMQIQGRYLYFGVDEVEPVERSRR